MSCTPPNPCDPTQPVAGTCAPTSFCHPGLLGLPEQRRINLIGTQQGSQCMSVLPRTGKGFVVADGQGGQFLTQQPSVEIPHLKSYILDQYGRKIVAAGGGYEEDDPPGIPSFIGADGCGQQWRWQGKAGVRQRIEWNGCNFIVTPHEAEQTLDMYPAVEGPGTCNTHEVVLYEQNGVVSLAYRVTPSIPPGTIAMWGGPAAPAGWLMCDGASYDPDSWPELFAAIGFAHGQTGSGNFNVPDPRGRFLRGTDNGAGNDGQAATRIAAATGGNTGDNVGSVEEIEFTPTDDADDRLWNIYLNFIIFPGCPGS